MAPIRCGGVPTSYSKQLLVVGDAAGHVDPLTGALNVAFLCSVALLSFVLLLCVCESLFVLMLLGVFSAW